MLEFKKSYSFSDVTILPNSEGEVDSRKKVNLIQSLVTPHSQQKIESVGVIVANMDSVGSFSMARAIPDFMVALRKAYENDTIKNSTERNVFLTCGLEDISVVATKIYTVSHTHKPLFINLDIANGHLKSFTERVRVIRDFYPTAVIMAGNVVTLEGAENLYRAGADIIKIGIAQGGHCDTKNKAAVGLGQASAIMEIRAGLPPNVLLCSDGGIRQPADFCKAFALGANFVMAGTIFAGYAENETDWYMDRLNYGGVSAAHNWYQIDKVDPTTAYKERAGDIGPYMNFYGMSSKTANEKYNGGLAHYKTSEGKESKIQYKGPVSTLVADIKGSLTSCCAYSNCFNLQDLHKNAHIRVTT